jgi:hypothetical protein
MVVSARYPTRVVRDARTNPATGINPFFIIISPHGFLLLNENVFLVIIVNRTKGMEGFQSHMPDCSRNRSYF